MRTLWKLKGLWRETGGQDLIEWALICATLVVVALGVLPSTILRSVIAVFTRITGSFASS